MKGKWGPSPVSPVGAIRTGRTSAIVKKIIKNVPIGGIPCGPCPYFQFSGLRSSHTLLQLKPLRLPRPSPASYFTVKRRPPPEGTRIPAPCNKAKRWFRYNKLYRKGETAWQNTRHQSTKIYDRGYRHYRDTYASRPSCERR